MSVSILAYRKAPGMLVTTMYCPSFVSIAHDFIMASSDTVVNLVSALVVYSHWVLPLVHPCAFIVPYLFSFKKH